MRTIFVVLVAVPLLVSAAAAQSLGEVARQEEARRKTVGAPARVYTNESLRPDSSASAPPAQPAPSDKPATPPSGGTQAADDKKQGDKKDGEQKDEGYWRDRVKNEREALDRAQTFAEALQSRINGLATDFAARDDPFQRATISSDRNKALAELDRVKGEIEQHTKALNDIQEEARKAGVPAGWVR
jgi:hypothetical protein